jgi:shikimate dehydrogenase
MDQVDYVSGRTRLFGIVGHPIEQVRSPEMITAEMTSRGHDAVLVPMHVLPGEFDAVLPQLMRLRNLGGLVFTIPYKARACALADEIGPQARAVGAINALARGDDGAWRADIFDGLGCVEAFRRRGIGFAGKRVMLIGAGGAGSAIAHAIGFERPASLAIFDVDDDRARNLALAVAANSRAPAAAGPVTTDGIDILLNATPVGMLDDARLPIDASSLPRDLVVFDAIVKPERTPLLSLAEQCGCTTVMGREMMRGQIARMVDFFFAD